MRINFFLNSDCQFNDILKFYLQNYYRQFQKSLFKGIPYTSLIDLRIMRSSMPFRKLVSTPKQIGQSTQKKSQNFKHERIGSMLELLKINSKEVFDESDQKKPCNMTQRAQLNVQQFIQKQFEKLLERIKLYCQSQSAKFIQLSQMQKIMTEQKKWHDNRVRQQDVIKLFYQRIKQFMQQNDFEKIEKISIKKLDFLSQNQHSYRNSYSKEINETFAETEQKERIQGIEIPQYRVSKPNMRVNMKSTGEKFYPPNFFNYLPMSCSSTVSQILYKQAQNKPFLQFHNFCQKILLQSKPIISDVNVFKNQQVQKTNSYLNQIYKKLNLLNTQLSNFASGGQISPFKKEMNFHENKKKNIGEEIDYICSILKKINQVHNIDSLFLSCQRPCCKFQSSPVSVQTKAKILINLKQAAKKSIHYKTQVTDNYFNRYYNHEKFDMTRVYSLAKTKNQQMQNLQKNYYKNKDKSKPCKKRSQSLYENF